MFQKDKNFKDDGKVHKYPDTDDDESLKQNQFTNKVIIQKRKSIHNPQQLFMVGDPYLWNNLGKCSLMQLRDLCKVNEIKGCLNDKKIVIQKKLRMHRNTYCHMISFTYDSTVSKVNPFCDSNSF